MDLGAQSRERALLTSASTAADPLLRARVLLRRARWPGDLPITVDFGRSGNSWAFTIGPGWSDNGDEDGRWTIGPVAQILLTTNTPMEENLLLHLHFTCGLAPGQQRRRSVALDVNGEALFERHAEIGGASVAPWTVPVPAPVVAPLGAMLVTLRVAGADSAQKKEPGDHPRELVLKMRRLLVERSP